MCQTSRRIEHFGACCHALVLDDLDASAVADNLGAVLQRLDPANVEAYRRIELQRPTTGSGLRTTEHDAYLFAELIDEDCDRVRLVEVAGQLAEGLTHQAGLEA